MAGGKTVVELRVHGVSGTPPEAMLSCPTEFLKRVAGDRDAGFYRRAQWIDDTVSPPQPGTWRRLTEAYSWGGLTSRRATRVVWLLFLPFTLVNLAHWMLPPATGKRFALLAVAVMRLLALSFTVTLLLSMAVTVLDVVVWQCLDLQHCSQRWGPLSSWAALPSGRQMFYGALPLVGVIVVLWLLGREELDTQEDRRTPPAGAVMVRAETPLADDTFWIRDRSVMRLRACHVTVWSSGLAALVLGAPARHGASEGVKSISIGLLVANLVLVTLAVAAVASNKATARGGPGAERIHGAVMALRWLALVLLAATLLWVARADVARLPGPTHLPGLRAAIYVLLAVQVVLLITLFACTALSMRGRTEIAESGYRSTLGGYVGPFVVLLGWLIGGGLSVGVGLGVAEVLGTVVVSTARAREDGVDALIVPPPYVWAAVAIALVIVAAVVAVAFVWFLVVPRRTAEFRSAAAGDYPDATPPDPVMVERIAKARALASLTDLGAKVVAGLAVVAVVVVVAMAVYYLSDTSNFDAVLRLGWITEFSVLVAAALSAAIAVLTVQAWRNAQLRKVVAILWDVVTFWPRANHPLTPPSYGKRTVWDLRTRLAALDTTDSKVVLVAHSQGTIIAAATLLQATGFENAAERYPLLTFGSPLRRLYAQNFPAYFGHETMAVLWRRQTTPAPRWINLWACTDPIGGWVFNTSVFAARGDLRDALPTVDCRIADVAHQDPTGPVCGHSDFWNRAEFGKAVDALQAITIGRDAEPESV